MRRSLWVLTVAFAFAPQALAARVEYGPQAEGIVEEDDCAALAAEAVKKHVRKEARDAGQKQPNVVRIERIETDDECSKYVLTSNQIAYGVLMRKGQSAANRDEYIVVDTYRK